jgi:hypothetical protein
MLKIAFTTITTAAIMLAVSYAPASARICKRICQDGVCWSDCSKLPGQNNVSSQGANQNLAARRAVGRR